MKAYSLLPLWARLVFARAGQRDRAFLIIAMVFVIAVLGPYLAGVVAPIAGAAVADGIALVLPLVATLLIATA